MKKNLLTLITYNTLKKICLKKNITWYFETQHFKIWKDKIKDNQIKTLFLKKSIIKIYIF